MSYYIRSLLNYDDAHFSLVTSLDELLNGGLLRGQLTEVCGTPGSGKTQVWLNVQSHSTIHNVL